MKSIPAQKPTATSGANADAGHQNLSDMLSRFGFHSMPFTRELAVKDRFAHPTFEAASQGLYEAVLQRMCAAFIAPAGLGKTALLRELQARLPAVRYDTRYLDITALNKRDFCREVAAAVGAKAAGTYPALVRNIKERFLNSMEVDGRRPVLMIDNSHEFRHDVIGVIRLLTNFEMDSQLVVSIILAGQLPLASLLRRTDLEDIQGRLAHIAYLTPLSRADGARYIEHRCRIAGATTVPFDALAIEAIYEISRGNLRAIDRISRKALSIAHHHAHDRVDANHISEARSVLWP
jgi:type II secretory pathway predicted ATPase ExeA